MENAHETQTQIVVSLYDGGGVDVHMRNYRPLSLHCRVWDVGASADAVAAVVRGLVAEWINDQWRRKRIRRL